MNDQEFRKQYQPLQVPAHFDENGPIADQTLFALALLDTATADEVVGEIKVLRKGEVDKALIAGVHEQLTEWYEKGLITGIEEDGELDYTLHKITKPNEGRVDPDLLAPGLD